MRFSTYVTMIVVLAVATTASGNTVTIKLKSYNSNGFTATETSAVNFGFSSPKSYHAGLFGITSSADSANELTSTRSVATTPTYSGSSGVLKIAAFCIDLAETVSLNTDTVYQVATSLTQAPVFAGATGNVQMTAARAKAVAQLWKAHISDVLATGSYSSKEASAFQLALHEIIFERTSAGGDVTYGDWSLSTGTYTVTGSQGDAITLANTWLSSGNLYAGLPEASLKALIAPTLENGNKAYQDLLVEVEDSGQNIEVPEPSVAAMVFGLGLVLGASHWWRRRTNCPFTVG